MVRLSPLLLCAALAMPLAACSSKDDTQMHDGFGHVPHAGYTSGESGTAWRDIWNSLSVRLQKDGVDAARTQELFSRLNTPRTLVPMGAKIKDARGMRIPVMAVVGDKEMENKTFSVRTRREDQLGEMDLETFVKKLNSELENRF